MLSHALNNEIFYRYACSKAVQMYQQADTFKRIVDRLPLSIDAEYTALEPTLGIFADVATGFLVIRMFDLDVLSDLRKHFPPVPLTLQLGGKPPYAPLDYHQEGLRIQPIIYQVLTEPIEYEDVPHSNILLWYSDIGTDRCVISAVLPESPVSLSNNDLTLTGIPFSQDFTISGESPRKANYGFIHWNANDADWEITMLKIAKGEFCSDSEWADVIEVKE